MKNRLNSKIIASMLVENKLTQKELANNAGVAYITLNSAFNGRSCSKVTVGKLAKALGVDVKDILED